MSFAFGDTIVKFGWYLQVCMVFYLLFYISFKWVKDPVVGMIINSCLILSYCIISYLLDVSSTWFECSLSMIAGMTMARLNSKVSEYPISKQFFLLVIAGSIFAMAFILSGHKSFTPDMKLIFKIISSVTFSMTIYFICFFVPLKGGFLKWLGGHYLEIYVLQGVSILLSDRYIGRDKTYLYFAFSMVFTLILAAICKKPIDRYMAMVKSIYK